MKRKQRHDNDSDDVFDEGPDDIFDDDLSPDFAWTNKMVFENLRKAGYESGDGTYFDEGLLLYSTALELKTAILYGTTELHDGKTGEQESVQEEGRTDFGKVGRNDPCPCGSGKKFKKCCLSANGPAAKKPWKPAPGPFVEPEVLPNVKDPEAMLRDMQLLEVLMMNDPGLRKVRFSRLKVVDYAEKAIARAPKGLADDPDRLPPFLGKLANRYVKEVEGGDILQTLGDALTEAARRVRSPEEFRSIVLAKTFCLKKRSAKNPHPLVSLIFRLSLFEQLQSEQEMHTIAESLGPVEAMDQKLKGGEPGFQQEFRTLVEKLDPVTLETMQESFFHHVEIASTAIREGKFPVLLPWVTIMPCVAALRALERTTRIATKHVEEELAKAANAIDGEDVELYKMHLDKWLKDDDARKNPDENLRDTVSFVRTMAATGDLDPLTPELMLETVRSGRHNVLDDEVAFEKSLPNGPLDRDYCEKYARFYEEKGFSAIARRIRGLTESELLAPPTVEEKKAPGRKTKKKKMAD